MKQMQTVVTLKKECMVNSNPAKRESCLPATKVFA